jgi:hypothetical protein
VFYSKHVCPVLQFLCCSVVGLSVLFYSRPFNAVLHFISESVFLAFFPFRTFHFITFTLFSKIRVVIVLVYPCAAVVTLHCLLVVTKIKN